MKGIPNLKSSGRNLQILTRTFAGQISMRSSNNATDLLEFELGCKWLTTAPARLNKKKSCRIFSNSITNFLTTKSAVYKRRLKNSGTSLLRYCARQPEREKPMQLYFGHNAKLNNTALTV